MMVAAAKKFQEGGPAIGTDKRVRYVDLASFEGIVPKSTDWRTLGIGRESALAK
jgi:phthalate 4,5-dioxygenase oxygenase subunit